MQVRRWLVVAAAASLPMLVSCGGAASSRSPAASHTATPASYALADLQRPGACAAVIAVRRGTVITSQTAGLPAAESERALFDIGSAAKSITATAVLLLEQQGRLDLSASISDYLPDVPAPDRTITVSQLLSHSSGLPENFTSDQRRLSQQQAIELILALPRHSAHRRPECDRRAGTADIPPESFRLTVTSTAVTPAPPAPRRRPAGPRWEPAA